VSNLALYIPLRISEPISVVKAGWRNGATATGHIDVGVYDINGNRLVSSGSTLQSGANALQVVNLASTALGIGRYWLAMACDLNTATVFATTTFAAALLSGFGVKEQTTAFPLPATMTDVSATGTRFPFVGLSVLSTWGN
jgi:hypothetical protein